MADTYQENEDEIVGVGSDGRPETFGQRRKGLAGASLRMVPYANDTPTISSAEPTLGDRASRLGTSIGSGMLSALGRVLGTIRSGGRLPRLGPNGQVLYETGGTPVSMGDAIMGPKDMSKRTLAHETKHSQQAAEQGLSFLAPWKRPEQELEALQAEGGYTGESPQYDTIKHPQLGEVRVLNREWAAAHPDYQDAQSSADMKRYWREQQARDRLGPARAR